MDVKRVHAHLQSSQVRDVAVIGGGFIGVEVAENLKKDGYNVTLIEAVSQILSPFDHDIVQVLHKEL